jgi:hypothetical protein
VPRVERVFRKQREEKIEEWKSNVDIADRNGGNVASVLQGYSIRLDGYQNLSEEEKEAQWKARWELPRPAEERAEYEERIAKHRTINAKTVEIVTGIEKIQTNMEEDRKHWQASEEVRQLQNIRTTRGRQRILRGTT